MRAIAPQVLLTHPGVACAVVRGSVQGVVGADGENGIPDDSFLTPEARALAEQMRKMEAVLLEEEAELARQDRIIEIERREEEMFPEKVKDDAADINGVIYSDTALTIPQNP